MNKRALIKRIIKRKERRVRELKEHTTDSSSIGDMAFLLLIFFIVTGSFMLRQGISFTLPSSSGAVQVNPSDLVELYPDSKGIIYNKRLIDREEALEILKKKKEELTKPVAVIKMRDDVKYDRLVDVLSIVREVGMSVSLKNIVEE